MLRKRKMCSWIGISCCLSGLALYLLAKSRDVEALKSVIKVNQLKELAKLLDVESKVKVIPLLVAISGKVGSETPIDCKHSDFTGVIVEETAEKLFLKHRYFRSWLQDSVSMLSTRKEVPWYLDDGTGKVFVEGARDASGFALTVVSEVFKEYRRSFWGKISDYLRGLKVIGVKRIERVLPTCTSLTVIGEAVKDNTGTIRIQRPHQGPFYVSPITIDELTESLGKWTRRFRYASAGLIVFGVFLIAKHAIRYIMGRRHQQELLNRVLAAERRRQFAEYKREAAEHRLESVENGREAAEDAREGQDLCIICFGQKSNAAFVPCGHMSVCFRCSSPLIKCPLCRRWIERKVKIYRN